MKEKILKIILNWCLSTPKASMILNGFIKENIEHFIKHNSSFDKVITTRLDSLFSIEEGYKYSNQSSLVLDKIDNILRQRANLEVVRQLNEILSQEEVIDNIVDRIKRKQLN